MSTLKLGWRAPRRGEIPFRPISDIQLTWVSTDDDGQYPITPQCVSIEELEVNVRELKAELDRCVALARRKYARERESYRL